MKKAAELLLIAAAVLTVPIFQSNIFAMETPRTAASPHRADGTHPMPPYPQLDGTHPMPPHPQFGGTQPMPPYPH